MSGLVIEKYIEYMRLLGYDYLTTKVEPREPVRYYMSKDGDVMDFGYTETGSIYFIFQSRQHPYDELSVTYMNLEEFNTKYLPIIRDKKLDILL